ncbi:hypothetical protein PENTCL1PPCAC_236 [Pristionchus entomophagus]|uniref:Uncharacterized protein n=1 Tax=Pristionchus entomophagus TaxID=358040 RepID=A0AAV5S607_9BILA|nr:hypothetical protein PENTCL1PPCAC_236 [Pristionchus entomophagus]
MADSHLENDEATDEETHGSEDIHRREQDGEVTEMPGKRNQSTHFISSAERKRALLDSEEEHPPRKRQDEMPQGSPENYREYPQEYARRRPETAHNTPPTDPAASLQALLAEQLTAVELQRVKREQLTILRFTAPQNNTRRQQRNVHMPQFNSNQQPNVKLKRGPQSFIPAAQLVAVFDQMSPEEKEKSIAQWKPSRHFNW